MKLAILTPCGSKSDALCGKLLSGHSGAMLQEFGQGSAAGAAPGAGKREGFWK